MEDHADPRSPRLSDDSASARTRQRVQRIQQLAHLLDSQFRVPGTSFRFGLDALIGLLPGIGDAAGLALSTGLIVQAIRAGARPVTVLRMMGIAGIDALLGAVPVIGSVVDFVLKANQRNARIVVSQSLEPQRTTQHSNRVVIATLLATAVLFCLIVFAATYAFVALVRALL